MIYRHTATVEVFFDMLKPAGKLVVIDAHLNGEYLDYTGAKRSDLTVKQQNWLAEQSHHQSHL